jgi:hypothetical protein
VVASDVLGLAGEEKPTLVVTPIGEEGTAEGAVPPQRASHASGVPP